jgi:hypothetical protein
VLGSEGRRSSLRFGCVDPCREDLNQAGDDDNISCGLACGASGFGIGGTIGGDGWAVAVVERLRLLLLNQVPGFLSSFDFDLSLSLSLSLSFSFSFSLCSTAGGGALVCSLKSAASGVAAGFCVRSESDVRLSDVVPEPVPAARILEGECRSDLNSPIFGELSTEGVVGKEGDGGGDKGADCDSSNCINSTSRGGRSGDCEYIEGLGTDGNSLTSDNLSSSTRPGGRAGADGGIEAGESVGCVMGCSIGSVTSGRKPRDARSMSTAW